MALAMINLRTKFGSVYDYLQRIYERQLKIKKLSFWDTLWGT